MKTFRKIKRQPCTLSKNFHPSSVDRKSSAVNTTLFCIISARNLQKISLVPYRKFLTYHSRTLEDAGALSPRHFRLSSDDSSCCSSIEYFSVQTILVPITRSKTRTALSLIASESVNGLKLVVKILTRNSFLGSPR